MGNCQTIGRRPMFQKLGFYSNFIDSSHCNYTVRPIFNGPKRQNAAECESLICGQHRRCWFSIRIARMLRKYAHNSKAVQACTYVQSANLVRHLAHMMSVRDLHMERSQICPNQAFSIPEIAGRHSPTGWPKPHVRTSTLLIIIRVRVCVTLAHCTYVRIGWHQHLTTVFPKSLCKTPLTNGPFCE